MLSSYQVQVIEGALRNGMVIKRYSDTVLYVLYPSGAAPVLEMGGNIGISTLDVKASEIIIGDYLSKLQPR